MDYALFAFALADVPVTGLACLLGFALPGASFSSGSIQTLCLNTHAYRLPAALCRRLYYGTIRFIAGAADAPLYACRIWFIPGSLNLRLWPHTMLFVAQPSR